MSADIPSQRPPNEAPASLALATGSALSDAELVQLLRSFAERFGPDMPGVMRMISEAARRLGRAVQTSATLRECLQTRAFEAEQMARDNNRLCANTAAAVDVIDALATALQHESAIEQRGLTTVSWDALEQASDFKRGLKSATPNDAYQPPKGEARRLAVDAGSVAVENARPNVT